MWGSQEDTNQAGQVLQGETSGRSLRDKPELGNQYKGVCVEDVYTGAGLG